MDGLWFIVCKVIVRIFDLGTPRRCFVATPVSFCYTLTVTNELDQVLDLTALAFFRNKKKIDEYSTENDSEEIDGMRIRIDPQWTESSWLKDPSAYWSTSAEVPSWGSTWISSISLKIVSMYSPAPERLATLQHAAWSSKYVGDETGSFTGSGVVNECYSRLPQRVNMKRTSRTKSVGVGYILETQLKLQLNTKQRESTYWFNRLQPESKSIE